MPFGFSNMSSTFMHLMTQVLQKFMGVCLVVYFDDVLIYRKDIVSHLKDLREVLTEFKNNELKLNVKKCEFILPEVLFLGFIVGNGQVKMDPGKITTLMKWPTPTSVTEVRSFLGLASFYRKFIWNFGAISAPMSDCLKGLKSSTFMWTSEANRSFEKLKTTIFSAPVLTLPDFDEVFELQCNASIIDIGAFLLQAGHLVAFLVRSLRNVVVVGLPMSKSFTLWCVHVTFGSII